MLKKTAGTVVALLMVVLSLWLVPMVAAADSGDMSRVDAVIIIDVSSSMNYKGAENDSLQNVSLYDAAYDAATMFIHMCEMNGSRVAVVPFSDEVFETTPATGDYAWCTLRDISNANVRDELVKKIRALKTDNATNLGAAMQKAYEIIEASRSDDEANQPMILLLTDGAVELFENGRRQEEASEASAAQAVEYAAKSRDELGCKLYCVGLKGKTFDGESLYQYTNSDMIHVTEDSAQLPSFFNDVFAKQIGAQILGDSHIEKTFNDDGTVTLTIRIPNNSILEANIILNCGEDGNPYVANNDGSDVTHDDGVHLFSGKSYCIVKIENPSAGYYYVTYEPGTEEDINVSLVTNYKVQYQVEMETSLRKNEPFTVNAYFTENGAHTSDTALYTGDMSACVLICDPEGNWTSYEMQVADPEGDAHFTCELPAMGAGIYQVYATVQGEGLERTSDVVEVEMVNNAPVLYETMDETVELSINDILNPNSPKKAQYTLVFGDYFMDEDTGDSLWYEIDYEGDSVKEYGFTSEGDLMLTTTGHAGETHLTVHAYDENGACAEEALTFTVAVTDIEALLHDGSTLVMETENEGVQPKGSDVRVLIGLKDQDGKWITSQDINDYLVSHQSIYWQSDVASHVTDQPLTLVFDDSVGCLVGTVPTENRSGRYNVGGAISGQEEYWSLSDGTGFDVGNSAPEATADEAAEEMRIEPLPMDLTFGFEPLTERSSVEIDITTLISDADNEVLTYSFAGANGESLAESGTMSGEEDKEVAAYTLSGNTLTLTAVNAGESTLLITATDGDGESATVQLNISVVSIRLWLLIHALKILALAVAAILVIRLFYTVALKPSYPRKRELQVSVNGTYRNTYSVVGKKKYKLSTKADSASCNDAGLTKADLSKITIQPAMGGSILVKNKTKKKSRIKLTVNDRDVRPGKKDRMSLGGKIRISKGENSSYLTLVYKEKD